MRRADESCALGRELLPAGVSFTSFPWGAVLASNHDAYSICQLGGLQKQPRHMHGTPARAARLLPKYLCGSPPPRHFLILSWVNSTSFFLISLSNQSRSLSWSNYMHHFLCNQRFSLLLLTDMTDIHLIEWWLVWNYFLAFNYVTFIAIK